MVISPTCHLAVPLSTASDLPTSADYLLSPEVTLFLQDGRVRLLDLERGRFYALDGTGAQLLTLTLRFGSKEAVCRIAQEYGISQERVLADCNKLLGNLRRRRLIVSAISLRDKRRTPNRLTIWLLLTGAWLSLRFLGWAGTLRLWRRGRSDRTVFPQGDAEATVQQLDQSIRAAAALHPLNTQCKERALVAWHILRNWWRLPAELVIGILPYPFEAHAWVECGPWTVTDERFHCDPFHAAARYD
jgi:hypothetical protein